MSPPEIPLCFNHVSERTFKYGTQMKFCLALKKKGKNKGQGVSQLQTAALPRHREEDETDKTKPEIEQTYEKHQD